MFNKLVALSILGYSVTIDTLEAIAQQTVPQAPQGYYGHGPWHMWNDGYGWHFWWMFPLMMLFIFVVCAAIFFLARWSGGHGMHHWGPPSHTNDRPWSDPSYSALEILNERFARGEIQKDEYAEKKAAILSGARR